MIMAAVFWSVVALVPCVLLVWMWGSAGSAIWPAGKDKRFVQITLILLSVAAGSLAMLPVLIIVDKNGQLSGSANLPFVIPLVILGLIASALLFAPRILRNAKSAAGDEILRVRKGVRVVGVYLFVVSLFLLTLLH